MCAQSWQDGKHIGPDVLSRFMELAGGTDHASGSPRLFLIEIQRNKFDEYEYQTLKFCFKNVVLFYPEYYRASARKLGLAGRIRPAEILWEFSYNVIF
jgi:hypothetical protein